MDYEVLKDKIVNDLALNQLAEQGRDADIANRLNAVDENVRIARGVVPAYEIVAAIVPTDWAAATAAEKQRVQLIVSAGQVDTLADNVRSAFQAAFGVGTQTRANLIALLTRAGSLAEQIVGQNVTAADVAVALMG